MNRYSLAAANLPPIIRKVGHFPVIPTSADAVTISCQLTDESATGLSSSLDSEVGKGSRFELVLPAQAGER